MSGNDSSALKAVIFSIITIGVIIFFGVLVINNLEMPSRLLKSSAGSRGSAVTIVSPSIVCFFPSLVVMVSPLMVMTKRRPL